MQEDELKEHFKQQAGEYVELMERLVPEYIKQQEFLCKLIPFDRTDAIRVLDLGAGPGVLSELVLNMFPRAKVLAFDLTEELLAVGKQRLSKFEGRFAVKQGNFKRESFGADYDVILAGLTLQHLTNEERQNIFSRLYDALNKNGIFLAREIVVDEDPFITEWHISLWRSFMRSNGEDDAFRYKKHREKGYPVSVKRQLSWLRDAGFVHTACHWRYWNFAIISGRKMVVTGWGDRE